MATNPSSEGSQTNNYKGSAVGLHLISDSADDSEVMKVDDMNEDISQNSGFKTDREKKDEGALTPECDELAFYKSTVPDKIKDASGKCCNDQDYDPRTLLVPDNFILKQSPTMRQWWTLKSQYYDTMLFFKMGENYHLFYKDAEIGLNELGLQVLKSDEGGYDYCSIPEISFGKFLDILIDKGYKVGRVEETETHEQMVERLESGSEVDRVVSREVCSVQSRGTKKSSFINGKCCHDDHTFLLAISEKIDSTNPLNSTYGVCFVDVMIGTFHVGQFEDDRHGSRLRTLMSHFPPSEVLYERGNVSEKTKNVIDGCSIQPVVEGLRSGVEFWNGNTTLNELSEAEYFVVDGEGLKWPQIFDEMMHEDESFGLMPRDHFGQGLSALGAVMWFLRRCRMDVELLSLRSFEMYTTADVTPEPAIEVERDKSIMALDGVTLANLRVLDNSGTSEGTLLQKLDSCKTPFGKRLIKKWLCAPPRSTVVINDRLNAVEDIKSAAGVVSEVSDILSKLPDLERLINRIHAYSLSRRIHPDARAVCVDEVTYEKRKMEEFITCLEGFKTAQLIVEKFDNSVDSFKSEFLKSCVKLKDTGGNFPILMKQLNYLELVIAKKRRDVAEKDTMRDIFEQFDKHRSLWSEAIHCLSILDVLISLANYSSQSGMCRPDFVINEDKSILEIRGGRHPCMEKNVWDRDFIPNDIVIGAPDDESSSSSHAMLLVGPSMSGKSTLMRQVGLIYILAQLGCHVPAKKCRLSPVDKILACVKSDEALCMLFRATKHSLVLLDDWDCHSTIGSARHIFLTKFLEYQCMTIFSTQNHSIVDKHLDNICVFSRYMVMHEMLTGKKLQKLTVDPMKHLADCYASLQIKCDEKGTDQDSYSMSIKENAIWFLSAKLYDFSPTDHLFSELSDHFTEFLTQLADYVKNVKGSAWFFNHLLDNLLRVESSWESVHAFFNFFTRNESLAWVLLEYEKEMITRDRKMTFLYKALSFGTDPKSFADVTDTENIKQIEGQIHQWMNQLQETMYGFFCKMISFGDGILTSLLTWIGDALHVYVAVRRDHENFYNFARTYHDDNFLMNLQSILLRLFESCVCERSDLLKIQITYCRATHEPREAALQKNVHMRRLTDSSLISSDEGSSSVTHLEDHYEMITEIFYMLNFCFKIGFSVTHGVWIKMQEESENNQNANLSSCNTILKQLTQKLMPCMAFSADFLVHTAMTPLGTSASSVNNAEFKPLSEAVGKALQFIPEFLVTNLQVFLRFLVRNTGNDVFEDEQQIQHLGSMLDFFLLYAFNPWFIGNSDIRMNMTESFVNFIPMVGPLGTNRMKLLVDNANAHHASECLMKLFVEERLTDENFTNNQLNRRMMAHITFQCLWKFQPHEDAVVKLKEYAELHLECAPLFLRFVDLLVNEATNILLEAQRRMINIRTSMIPHPYEVRTCRFLNIIGQYTIGNLETLTRFAQSMFNHPIMVDYVADMLNSYLLHLTGSKKVEITNPEELKFSPWELVLDVGKIYENLEENHNFLNALSSGLFPYSSDLLREASAFLTNIGGPEAMAAQFREMAAGIYEFEEDINSILPEYFDHFTDFLMRDPVELPDMPDVRFDRNTVIKFLMEKPENPFTKKYLTIDMVISDQKLKDEIEKRKIKLRNINQ